MSENKPIKNNRQFLAVWSILNLVGWIIGLYFVFLNQFNFEYDYRFSAWKTFLEWLPLGAGIGLLQWFKLRQLRINLFVWALITALGYSILVTLYFWVLNFDSFDYREYDIPDWVINTGLALTLPVGGAIIGGLQSIAARKYILRSDLWIRAYTFGLLLPPIVTPLSILVKSFVLNFLYSIEFYDLVDFRWYLFFGLLVAATAVFISILTGNVLLKQSNINSVTINGG